LDPETERRTLEIAPAVFFAHNFHGLCISGGKATQFPIIEPCERRFGPSCLLRYFPRRCGGLNPVTMMRAYQTNRQRLQVLAKYSAVITHGSHIVREYRDQGIRCEQIVFPIGRGTGHDVATNWVPDSELRLLMMGRMMRTKGGDVLLDALPLLTKRLQRPIRLIMAGDGPSRKSWEAKALELSRRQTGIQVVFPGWLSGSDREAALGNCDVLVLPSLWPEPFGMAGPEAGLHGVPCVAFRAGGIPDWLTEGVNGCLAPSNPPTAGGLADALYRCVSDESMYSKLREGARAASDSRDFDGHYNDLIRIFTRVLQLPGEGVSV
jgi:glycosyltransferase involved in cell wall biosynthesis